MLDPNLHDRFVSNTPGASHNGTFQYGSHDFSGVGWDNADTRKSITLISDTHFLAAGHFTPSTLVNFRDSSGVVHSHTVASYTTISNADHPSLSGNSDLIVGTLSSAVASGISHYSLLNPALNPVGQDVLLYGQKGRVGESTIVSHQDLTVSGVDGRTSISQYNIASGGPDDAFFTSGDSGGPSFIVDHCGDLIFSGVHWAVGNDAVRDPLDPSIIITPAMNNFNIDTHVSDYINQLNMIAGLESAPLSQTFLSKPFSYYW